METDKTYVELLSALKSKTHLAQQRAVISVNTEMLQLYWTIGNDISNKIAESGWGAKIIDNLSRDLKTEFPDNKGFSVRNLKYMRSFAEAYPDFVQPVAAQLNDTHYQANELMQGALAQTNHIILQPAVAKIPWTHHTIILDKVKTVESRLFYIHKTIENGWSKSILSLQIDNKLHERQGQAITNFDETLPKIQSDLAKQTLKNPYVFDFLSLSENVQERDMEKAMMSEIRRLLLELGKGFAYVGNQYHLQVGNEDFYMDLLFYNFHLHSFVVFELKMGDFKPEYAGKLNFYVNAIDEQIKSDRDNQTIGVLLCKTPNETVIKYSLKGINSPLGVADYQLPKTIKSDMPTLEELEAVINEIEDEKSTGIKSKKDKPAK